MEQIEKLVKTQVRYWKYDAYEDVYMNCWTISNHNDFGIYPKPEFKTEKLAKDFFRQHLITNYLKPVEDEH